MTMTPVSYTHLDVYKRQVQLTFVVVIGELFRIGAYGIEADEEVTAKAVAFTVVELSLIHIWSFAYLVRCFCILSDL